MQLMQHLSNLFLPNLWCEFHIIWQIKCNSRVCVSVSIFMNCDRHRDLSEIIAHEMYKTNKKNVGMRKVYRPMIESVMPCLMLLHVN